MYEKYKVSDGAESAIVVKYNHAKNELIIGGYSHFRRLIEKCVDLFGCSGDPVNYQYNKMKFVFVNYDSRNFDKCLDILETTFYVEPVRAHGRLL